MIPISRFIPEPRSQPDDQKDLAKILGKFEKKLYWVENINNKADAGELSCVFVDNTLLNELLQSRDAGTSYSAIRSGPDRPRVIAIMFITRRMPITLRIPIRRQYPSAALVHHTPNPHSQLTPADYDKSRALVKEVTPILQKYTHK